MRTSVSKPVEDREADAYLARTHQWPQGDKIVPNIKRRQRQGESRTLADPEYESCVDE
jgi:hypothetical protein